MTFDIGAEIARQGTGFAAAATVAITRYTEARERFALLGNYADELAADKPGKKLAAIIRIMTTPNALTGKQHSGSSASEIAETDAEYCDFLQMLRNAVRDRELAYGQAEAAKMQHATALALLSMAPAGAL